MSVIGQKLLMDKKPQFHTRFDSSLKLSPYRLKTPIHRLFPQKPLVKRKGAESASLNFKKPEQFPKRAQGTSEGKSVIVLAPEKLKNGVSASEEALIMEEKYIKELPRSSEYLKELNATGSKSLYSNLNSLNAKYFAKKQHLGIFNANDNLAILEAFFLEQTAALDLHMKAVRIFNLLLAQFCF